MNFVDFMELVNRGSKTQKEIDEILSQEKEKTPSLPPKPALNADEREDLPPPPSDPLS